MAQDDPVLSLCRRFDPDDARRCMDGALVPVAFISHASSDGTEQATRIDRALREKGVSTWLCWRDLDRSLDFTAALEKAIVAADALIACITACALRDDSFVRREIRYAQACGKPVAVARLAPIVPPLSVVTNTYFEFHQDWDAACSELVAFCRRVASAT